MLAIQGSYAPSLFRIRRKGLLQGNLPHKCPWYRLIRIREGAIDIDCDGVLHQARDGQVCLLPPNRELTITRDRQLRSTWLAFTVLACKHHPGRGYTPVIAHKEPSPAELWGCDVPIVQDQTVSGQVAEIIDTIAETAWQSDLDRLSGNQRLSYILECLVRAHYHNDHRSRIGNNNSHPINRIHNIIMNELASIQTAGDIARRLGVSISSMDKQYRAATGEAPMTFLRRYRLNEAARLLKNTHLKLDTIANHVGYRNAKALYQAWKQKYAMPPRRWRLHERSS